MKSVLRALFAFASVTAQAQVALAPGEAPDWAARAWSALQARTGLEISRHLNPFILRGDFDGDRRADLAVLVVDPKTKRQGIAFLLRGKRAVVVGAGNALGNGGDDFAWLDLWHVEDRGTGHGNHAGQSMRPGADGLVVAKDGSASALIYFRRGKPRWHQYGD